MNKKSNPLLIAIKFRINKFINKLANRISCEHTHYYDVYCEDTGLFLYSKCSNCGKKKSVWYS